MLDPRFWTILLIWAVVSYPLHVFLHELGHWLVAKSLGIKATIHMWPTRQPDGSVNFGYTTCKQPIPPERVPIFAYAPIIVEAVWWPGCFVGLIMVPVSLWPLLAFLCVETVASLIDALVWLLGFYTQRKTTDAYILQTALKWPVQRGKLLIIPWTMLATGSLSVIGYRLVLGR